MIWQSRKFAAVVLSVEIALIIVYTFFVTYDEEADGLKSSNKTAKDKTDRNSVQDYYPMFQDVNVMIFIGFGFLMTFMKKYGFSAVGLNLLLAAISIQWAIIMQGVWNMQDGKIPINIIRVAEIQSMTNPEIWKHCSGKDNPADLLTRGLEASSIETSSLWWYGPQRLKWKFIVQRAPWWGGFYERLVKSVKEPLKKILGKALLSFEEFMTLLTEIENILIQRPLTYVFDDLKDPEPLSPIHFLRFGSKSIPYPPNFAELINQSSSRESLTKRKNYQTRLLKQLWLK